MAANALRNNAKQRGTVDALMIQNFEKFEGVTAKVFRTAYLVAKENMAYTKFPSLIDL